MSSASASCIRTNSTDSIDSSPRRLIRKCKKEPIFSDSDWQTSSSFGLSSRQQLNDSGQGQKRKSDSQLPSSSGKKRMRDILKFDNTLEKSINQGRCCICRKEPRDLSAMRGHIISKHGFVPAKKSNRSIVGAVNEVKDEPEAKPTIVQVMQQDESGQSEVNNNENPPNLHNK